MNRSRLVTVLVAVIAFVAVAAVMSTLRGGSGTPAATAAQTPLQKAEANLRRRADDPKALVEFALASAGESHSTGDPRYNLRAEAAARRALRLAPRDFDALDALGSIALTRHRFAEALGYSRRSLAVAPGRATPLAIRADALIELGRYREAFATVERRLEQRPDLASYSRASYARELAGDHEGALLLMRMAAEAGGYGSVERADARRQVGLLLFGQGDIAGAEREFRATLGERPGDPHVTSNLGQAIAARGDLDRAVELYVEALDQEPRPEFALALAEIEQSRGRTAEAEEYLARFVGLQRTLSDAGEDAGVETALGVADLRTTGPEDIAEARAAQARRPGILGDQALGWVLTRAGRCEEGWRHARRSLRLGTQDARLLFRAGMAASCAGERRAAIRLLGRAVTLNPAFSPLWGPVARTELARLRGA